MGCVGQLGWTWNLPDRFGIQEFKISRPGRVVLMYAGFNRGSKLEISAKFIKQSATIWLSRPQRADAIERGQK
jgi:hypothetical protein